MVATPKEGSAFVKPGDLDVNQNALHPLQTGPLPPPSTPVRVAKGKTRDLQPAQLSSSYTFRSTIPYLRPVDFQNPSFVLDFRKLI